MDSLRRGFILSAAAAMCWRPELAHAKSGAQVSFTPDALKKLELAYQAGVLRDLHAVHVTLRGETVLERYYAGQDNAWGRDLGHVAFSADTLHDLRSVTKSVVSLLYSAALEEGLVPSPEASLIAQFPQYPELATDPRRQAWRISDALNMTLGVKWNEDLPYSDPNNSEIAMELAEDRYHYILSQPIERGAGEAWGYNGGCTALLGRIIEQGAGESLSAYAQKRLFEPLGIDQFEWVQGQDGAYSAASGLRLTAEGLSRIGRMVLAQGVWGERRVVPAAWLQSYLQPKAYTPFGMGYRRGWYHSKQPTRFGPVEMISAHGNGGQRLYLAPKLDLSVTAFAGAYNAPDQWLTPTILLLRVLLANLRRA